MRSEMKFKNNLEMRQLDPLDQTGACIVVPIKRIRKSNILKSLVPNIGDVPLWFIRKPCKHQDLFLTFSIDWEKVKGRKNMMVSY